MKNLRAILISFISICTLFILSNCGGPGTVSVGVGVGVGGPWGGGPYGYPGGTVWVGRPMGPPVYYHLDPPQEEGREWVEHRPEEISLDKN
ncbi:MAG: hypothetical protein GQ561_05050 [Calditrichae bacterium]|nr:hypothetical protein [Calditrichia bacterium]